MTKTPESRRDGIANSPVPSVHVRFARRRPRPHDLFYQGPATHHLQREPTTTLAYLAGIAKNLECRAIEIGGVADHVHLLIELSAKINIAELAQKLKANSSRWMHENGSKLFAWQTGYAAFGVSISNRVAVREYIRDQQQHHAKRDHAAELDALFKKHGIVVPSLRDSQT